MLQYEGDRLLYADCCFVCELGLPNTNYTIAYAYSNQSLDHWTYGGMIIDGRGREIGEYGDTIASSTSSANTHGSICELNGYGYATLTC